MLTSLQMKRKDISMERRVLSSLALVLVLGTGARVSAQADTDAKARMQFQQGIELVEAGKFEQAAVAFETAYQIKPSYKILFNIAQVENEIGHFAAALQAYTRYLAEGGSEIPADRLATVKAEIERLNALVGTLEVRSGESGAVVFVDGKRHGATPLAGPVFLDLGDHEVTLKRGTETLHREIVRIQGGKQLVLEVGGEARPGAEEAEAAGAEPEQPPEAESGGKRLWTWVALGVGGAAAIGAAVSGGLASSTMSDLEDACPDSTCPASKQSDIDKGRNLALTADVLMGVAAVGIVAGVVLFFVEPGMGEKEVTVTPTASHSGGGLALTGRF
jgi:hypothetical protein